MSRRVPIPIKSQLLPNHNPMEKVYRHPFFSICILFCRGKKLAGEIRTFDYNRRKQRLSSLYFKKIQYTEAETVSGLVYLSMFRSRRRRCLSRIHMNEMVRMFMYDYIYKPPTSPSSCSWGASVGTDGNYSCNSLL